MIVGEILKENDFRVVRSNNGFNVVSRQSGEVVGNYKIRSSASAMADQLNTGPKIVSTSDGKVRAEFNGQRFNGTPKEVSEQLAKLDDAPIDVDDLDKASKTGTSKAGRFITFLLRAKVFAFIGAAQLVPVVATYFQQREMMTEVWKIYPEGHPFALGSPYAQEQIDRTMQPYLNAMYAAIAVIAVDVLVSMISGGKALRVLRTIYAGVPPAGPWGLILKGVMFALTEGALLAATWTIQRYGPDFFTAMANDKFDEWIGLQNDETVSTNSSSRTSEPDGEEAKQTILNKIRRELNNQEPEDNEEPSTSSSRNEPSTDDENELQYDFGR